MPPSHSASPDDVRALREYLEREHVDHRSWSDERLGGAITEAKEWIGGRRWSWKVVAENILIEGVPGVRR